MVDFGKVLGGAVKAFTGNPLGAAADVVGGFLGGNKSEKTQNVNSNQATQNTNGTNEVQVETTQDKNGNKMTRVSGTDVRTVVEVSKGMMTPNGETNASEGRTIGTSK